jgi:hypothetical protein
MQMRIQTPAALSNPFFELPFHRPSLGKIGPFFASFEQETSSAVVAKH